MSGSSYHLGESRSGEFFRYFKRTRNQLVKRYAEHAVRFKEKDYGLYQYSLRS